MKRYPPAHTPLSFRALVRAAVGTCARPGAAPVALENQLLARFAAERAVLFGSGTQALSAAIAAALAVRGDRPVAIPAYNCYDVATAAAGAGARILLYDVDPETLSPDWDSFGAALAGAGAAVVAPLYGVPVDWPRAERAAAAHGAVLIEDAAQGSGGSWHGSPLGSLGRISVLSFGRGKGWTGGGGGAVLLRGTSVDPASGLRPGAGTSVRTATLSAAQWLLSNPRLYALPAGIPWLHLGETVYKAPGGVHGLSHFSAALLVATAEAAISEAAARVRVGREYEQRFAHARRARRISIVEGGTAGYLRFPLRVPSQPLRQRVLSEYGHAGVAPGYPGRVTDLAEVHARLAGPLPRCAGASTLVREIITLPTHSRADIRALAGLADLLS